MNTHKRMSLITVVALLMVLPLATARAKGDPATPVASELPIGVLAQFTLDQLPQPHAEVWFQRVELEPDGIFSPGNLVGPAVVYVESGEVSLSADGDVQAGYAAASPSAVPASTGTTLRTGDSALVPSGSSMALENGAGDPARVLMLLMYSALDEGQDGGEASEPAGASEQLISAGLAEFPSTPGTVMLERVVVEPGATMSSSTMMGIELGAVEQGSAQVTVESTFPLIWSWPGILDAGTERLAERSPVNLTGTMDLAAGDGYAAYSGTLDWQATGDASVTVLRVVVTPHEA